MSVIRVPTSFNIDVEFEIPEFYRRLIALLIDLFVLWLYKKFADLILTSITGSMYGEGIDAYYNAWGLSLLLYLPIFLYHIVMEITLNGQSVGKKIMGLRVVNENGGRPAISQFLIRWFLRDIWFVILFMMGVYNSFYGSKTEGVILVLLVLAYFITELVLVVSSKKVSVWEISSPILF
ncbi:MAG: RDD family protein [Chitinophagaceae bacterium]